MLLEDEGQYNRLRQKVVQYIYVVSDGQIMQPPITIVVILSGVMVIMLAIGPKVCGFKPG
jgi:hypothetical protein